VGNNLNQTCKSGSACKEEKQADISCPSLHCNKKLSEADTWIPGSKKVILSLAGSKNAESTREKGGWGMLKQRLLDERSQNQTLRLVDPVYHCPSTSYLSGV